MTTEANILFELPPVIEFDKIEKRDVQEPDLSLLKNQQKEAFDKMWRFITETDGGMFLLQGFAGTGKTFVMSQFVENYLTKNRGKKIAVTAPTNKAVKVSADFAPYRNTNLKYGTIHSLLGLKEKIDAYGNQTFEKEWGKPCKLDEYDTLILDEVSMLPDDLFEMLTVFVNDNGLKIIFVGDPCQINPIGKSESIPLNPIKRKEYGIEMAELTEIVRQKEGNPLIEVTMQIRKNMNNSSAVRIRETEINQQGGVFFMDDRHTAVYLDDMLKLYFNSENFKKSADFVKVIAWRNKVVDFMNKKIRQYVFGPDAMKIEIGEKLIANKPIISDDGKTILFTTNDEMEVIEKTEDFENITDSIILKYYVTKVISHNGGSPVTQEIKIIHEDSEVTYKNILDSLINAARNKPKGSFQAKKAWEEYYEFMEYFADVKYCYAITAHKSQGSTYDTAIVLEGDMDNNSKIQERNRLKYTSFSRPSRLLVVVSA